MSFKGSPTVSPTIACLCSSDSRESPSTPPTSMNFFALSQAPPALPVKSANMIAESVEPIRRPATKSGPKMKPEMTGNKTAKSAEPRISFSAPFEEMAMHVS